MHFSIVLVKLNEKMDSYLWLFFLIILEIFQTIFVIRKKKKKKQKGNWIVICHEYGEERAMSEYVRPRHISNSLRRAGALEMTHFCPIYLPTVPSFTISRGKKK